MPSSARTMPARINGSAVRRVVRILQSNSSNPFSRPAISQNMQTCSRRSYASAVPLATLRLPDDYVPPTKPPTARRSEARKSQLIRVYTALLRSTPLILFFQHNNLTAVEWSAIRRELRKALSEVEAPVAAPGAPAPIDISKSIELTVLRTRMFDVAFKIAEFFDPKQAQKASNGYTHDLSTSAYDAVKNANLNSPDSPYSQIKPLLSGPVAAVTFPIVSPAHLAAVFRILAPSPPAFSAPTRRKNPGYYDPVAQSGLQKLILIGGRIEGKAFDSEGVKWVGSIEGGLDGLRAQLVNMLQSAGLGLTTTLEGGAKGLWLALEGRRTQLDEEQNGGKKEDGAEAEKE